GSIAPAVERAYGYNTNINAAKVQRVIDAIDKDKSIKAVVLRINSGGGSALESELIYQKLDILKARVPVVVSMGGAAASGGYYISCSSDYIVADEFTITGSIGVVMLIPEAEVLSRKIGIKNQHITFGKFASSYDVISKTDPEFLASLKRNSDAVYTEFKSRVEASREMEPGHLESIAQGQIWSAEAALENGLIDSIGTLQTAIAKAASLSGVVSYRRVNLPAKISWIEAFSGLSSSRISSLKSLVDFHANPANIKNLLRDQFPTLEWLYQTPMEVN
ncbi:MAG: signal peptide peptidase SppA, partial [Candidatus Cloacimonadaceae bacterium]|nr:signal peptide peptidase SppA [Candidatus Cloacimonadaceae bacterium]